MPALISYIVVCGFKLSYLWQQSVAVEAFDSCLNAAMVRCIRVSSGRHLISGSLGLWMILLRCVYLSYLHRHIQIASRSSTLAVDRLHQSTARLSGDGEQPCGEYSQGEAPFRSVGAADAVSISKNCLFRCSRCEVMHSRLEQALSRGDLISVLSISGLCIGCLGLTHWRCSRQIV
jgi:hypothetical protein